MKKMFDFLLILFLVFTGAFLNQFTDAFNTLDAIECVVIIFALALLILGRTFALYCTQLIREINEANHNRTLAEMEAQRLTYVNDDLKKKNAGLVEFIQKAKSKKSNTDGPDKEN